MASPTNKLNNNVMLQCVGLLEKFIKLPKEFVTCCIEEAYKIKPQQPVICVLNVEFMNNLCNFYPRGSQQFEITARHLLVTSYPSRCTTLTIQNSSPITKRPYNIMCLSADC
jgi:hypothetical protein